MFQGRNLGARFPSFSILLTLIQGCLLFVSSYGNAQSLLSLHNISFSDPSIAKSLGVDEVSLLRGFSADLSQQTSSEYLYRLGNAIAFTQAGLSGDYGTSYKHFILTASAGLGYQEGYASIEDVLKGKQSLDEMGAFSAQAQITLGFRFHNEQRSRFYLSFASSGFSRNTLDLESHSWGFLWQYDLVSPRTLVAPLVSWQGFRGGVGLRYNRFRSKYSQTFSNLGLEVSTPAVASLPSQTLSLSVSVDGLLSGEADVLSFPLEIGTGFQCFQVLTLYGLLGADTNVGTVKGRVRAQGPVSVSHRELVAGETQSKLLAQAYGQYYAYKEAKPEAFALRALIGLQFDLGQGSVFIQYQRGSLEGSEAAALGFRAFY
jgi:hypothetical protein